MAEFNRIAVIGTGTMGPGMGATLARIGVTVTMYDVSADALERAKGMVGMAEGVLDRLEAPSAPGGSVSYHTDLASALEGCDLVLEAIPERLEMARALATEPELLLLDEIAGGLTERECQSLLSAIRDVHASGVTIVWIEHVVHALLSVAQRLVVLNFGELIADGEPATVMNSKDVKSVYLGEDAHV